MPLKLLGTALEIQEDFERKPGKIRYALLDFDGTISLLRAGWQQFMVDQFVEVLISTTDTGESKSELTDVCQLFITRLTGRQTIYQMLQLEEEVIKRGGQPLPAAVYKKDYLERIGRRIATRIESVKRMQVKRQQPVDHMKPGQILDRVGVSSSRFLKQPPPFVPDLGPAYVLWPHDPDPPRQFQQRREPRLHDVVGIATGRPMQEDTLNQDISVGTVLGENEYGSGRGYTLAVLEDEAVGRQRQPCKSASKTGERQLALEAKDRW